MVSGGMNIEIPKGIYTMETKFNNRGVKMKEGRRVRYLCPVCFKDSNINVIKYPKAKVKEDNFILTNTNVTDLKYKVETYVDFYGVCKSCGYPVTFIDIDEGMVDIIQYLNNNGYNTEFCCEGHKFIDENNYDVPYLTFYCTWDDKTYLKMVRHLPESWQIYKTSLSKPHDYCYESEIRLYCKHPLKYKETYLKDLKEYIYKWFPKLN
jgi:hypothetical protein